MRKIHFLLALGCYVAFVIPQTNAWAAEQKCPVALDHIELSYAHQGGQSKPQLRINFGNAAGKQISTITFTLSILDPSGYPHPYPGDLVYRKGLEADAQKVFVWSLAQESVDIHRTGETVLVQEVEFSDATSWKDDGSESCELTVDFHPK